MGTKKQANVFGLYHMSGNVYEWVFDAYHSEREEDVANDKSSSYLARRALGKYPKGLRVTFAIMTSF